MQAPRHLWVVVLEFESDDTRYLAELAEYVAIPSVSRDATDDTMRRAAQWLVKQLSFARAHLVETDGNPVVVGEWMGAIGAPI